MTRGHEKLDVYRLSISDVAWVYQKVATLTGLHRSARQQWLRASQPIPLRIAEGSGKTTAADRRRYFEIAPGSALECAAMPYVLMIGKALDESESQLRKDELDRMATMLSRLAGRRYPIGGDRAVHGDWVRDVDFEIAFDIDARATATTTAPEPRP